MAGRNLEHRIEQRAGAVATHIKDEAVHIEGVIKRDAQEAEQWIHEFVRDHKIKFQWIRIAAIVGLFSWALGLIMELAETPSQMFTTDLGVFLASFLAYAFIVHIHGLHPSRLTPDGTIMLICKVLTLAALIFSLVAVINFGKSLNVCKGISESDYNKMQRCVKENQSSRIKCGTSKSYSQPIYDSCPEASYSSLRANAIHGACGYTAISMLIINAVIYVVLKMFQTSATNKAKSV